MDIKTFAKNSWKFIIAIIALVLILVFGCYYLRYKPPEVVQGTTQKTAETATGVKIAADKAGYNLDAGQAKQVATVIKEIRTTEKEPLYIVTTTGSEAKKEAEQARQDNKADFAIVTDKNNPDKKVDVDSLAIEKDKVIELNQYNIQAYKKVLRTLEYSPNGKEATLTISRKITNDGQYIGVGAGYNWEQNRVIAKISYTW